MARITIVGVQNWKTKDRQTGEEITGLSYVGFTETGQAIKFTSLEDYPVHTGFVGFDAAKAVEIPILTKFFAGKVSYQDGNSYGKEDE